MAACAFFADLFQPHTFDSGGSAGEIFFDDIGRKPDGVEDLRAAIGLVRRYPHLGHDFENALAEGLDVVLLYVVRGERQPALQTDMLERFERHVGIDRLGTVASQNTKMMHFARLSGLHDEARLHAQALADQVVVHGSSREKGWHGNAFGRDGAVGQDEDIVVGEDRLRRFAANALQRLVETGCAVGRRPGRVDRRRAERTVKQIRDGTDFFEIGIGEHRLRYFQPLVRTGLMSQQIGPGSDHRHQRHHQFFADRINRRIGDLRKILLEIIVEQPGFFREHGEGGVRAHGADGIVGRQRHRLQEELDILLRIPERLLAIEQRRRIIDDARQFVRQVGQFLKLELGFLQPFIVGFGGGQRALDLFVLDDTALFEVDQQHLARLQAPFAHNFLFRDRQYAGFGCQDHQIVVGYDETRRSQPIAIEGCADLPSIGECDRRRSIPGFEQSRMVFVKGLALGIHQRVAGPGFRDQHHHGMRQRIAAGHQQFQRVVEACRVGLAVRNYWPHLVEFRPQKFGFHGTAACIHPVHIAANRIDLSVVRDKAIGVSQLPRRECVGGKALMHHSNCRLRQRVAQVLVKLTDQRRKQQALIDNRARRKGRHVQMRNRRLAVFCSKIGEGVLRLLANDEEFALERVLILYPWTPSHDCLTDHRHRFENGFAQAGRVDGHVAPADQRLTLDPDEMLELSDRDIAGLCLARQKAHSHRVAARLRQIDGRLRGPVAQERMGNLDKAAGAVADRWVRPHRTAMIEIDKEPKALGDDRVGLVSLDIGNEPDAAGIVLIGRVIKPLFSWRFQFRSRHFLSFNPPMA